MLRIIDRELLGIRRRRCGRGFVYLDERGRRLTDRDTLQRIRRLAIPPAYADVRIAADPDAHLQAVGRDEAGRLQYRYHLDWEAVRETRKAEQLAALCSVLPQIRRKVSRDLRRRALDRSRVLAAVVAVIDRAHLRIGSDSYVLSGGSRGAATLLKRNVRCEGDRILFMFNGKGGKEIRCEVEAPALARTVAELERLPGRRLFQFRDANGSIQRVTADETNAYLIEIADAAVTAKDFRTLAATAIAAERLAALEPDYRVTRRRNQLRAVMGDIAEMLSNTPATARKSYVHPRLIESFENDTLQRIAARCRRRSRLSAGEALVAKLFED